jgi:hypothetical protein
MSFNSFLLQEGIFDRVGEGGGQIFGKRAKKKRSDFFHAMTLRKMLK